MLKLMFARPAACAHEARQIQQLARSRHALADWIARARMTRCSGAGAGVETLEFIAVAQTMERLVVTKQQDEAGEIPAMRRERDHFKARDFALRLKPLPVSPARKPQMMVVHDLERPLASQ